MGPAAKAPKFSIEATQLCSSVVRKSSEVALVVFEICGNTGAVHDKFVPRPNEPIVANKVPNIWVFLLTLPVPSLSLEDFCGESCKFDFAASIPPPPNNFKVPINNVFCSFLASRCCPTIFCVIQLLPDDSKFKIQGKCLLASNCKMTVLPKWKLQEI